MKSILPICAAGLFALTACASPTPPSISAAEVTAINDEYDRVGALPDTAIADLPPGSASYEGHVGGEISGDAEGSFVGDMTMNIEFAGNTIGGSIDNMNVIDDGGEPEQLLGGSLTINGTEADGILTATATGSLTAVGEEKIRGSSSVTLNLNGNVLTDTSDGDTVHGTMDGSGTGDFDITVYNGGFFGSN